MELRKLQISEIQSNHELVKILWETFNYYLSSVHEWDGLSSKLKDIIPYYVLEDLKDKPYDKSLIDNIEKLVKNTKYLFCKEKENFIQLDESIVITSYIKEEITYINAVYINDHKLYLSLTDPNGDIIQVPCSIAALRMKSNKYEGYSEKQAIRALEQLYMYISDKYINKYL